VTARKRFIFAGENRCITGRSGSEIVKITDATTLLR